MLTSDKKPWWLAGNTVPIVAYEATTTDQAGWEFFGNSTSTEFSTAIEVMFWPRVLTDAEVAHVYEANTGGKQCDCPLCTEGRRK